MITGSAKRIGAAIAEDLAANGINVIAHHNNSNDDAIKLCKKLEKHNIKAVALAGDLTKENDCRSLFQEAKKQLGPIDLLINNASIFEDDSVETFSEENFDTHFALHVKAPSFLAQEMAKQSELKEGLIVNIIDQRVWRINPKFYSYTLSKSALLSATKAMAQSLAPLIRVNGIGPGPTLANERQSEDDFKKQIDGLLLNKGPELTEFGSTVRYMWQTKSITGQMIALDGGQHLAWETPDIAGIIE